MKSFYTTMYSKIIFFIVLAISFDSSNVSSASLGSYDSKAPSEVVSYTGPDAPAAQNSTVIQTLKSKPESPLEQAENQVSFKRQIEKEKLALRQVIFKQNMHEKKAYHQYKMNVAQERNNFEQKVKKDNFEMEKEKDEYYREQRRQAGQKELERKKKANEASLKQKKLEAKEQLETQEEANSLALKRQRDQYEKDLEDQRQKNKARMESLKKQQEEEREKWNKLLQMYHKEHEEKLKEIPDSSKLEFLDKGETPSFLLDNNKKKVGVNPGRRPFWQEKTTEEKKKLLGNDFDEKGSIQKSEKREAEQWSLQKIGVFTVFLGTFVYIVAKDKSVHNFLHSLKSDFSSILPLIEVMHEPCLKVLMVIQKKKKCLKQI